MATVATRRIEEAAASATKAKPSPMKAKPEANPLPELIQRYTAIRQQAKALYEQADTIEQAILKALPVGSVCSLPDGRRAVVEDNFQDKRGNVRNVAFRPCGVKRFEIVVK